MVGVPAWAEDQTPSSKYSVHRWELETLVTTLFLNLMPRASALGIQLDCRQWQSITDLVNLLRTIENLEGGEYLQEEGFSILDEMHRIAQRQFHWQYGYFNLPQLYRYSYIYAQGQCGDYFQQEHGLPITELNFVGFAFFLCSKESPWISRSLVNRELGLTEDLVKRALPLLLTSVDDARKRTCKLVQRMNKTHGRALPTAYLPSILRRFPLLHVEQNAKNVIAPIPEALLLRVTSGLYFDVVEGGQPLLNEANERFEVYCASIIAAFMKRFTVQRAYEYKLKKGALVDSPDLLVRDGGKTAILVECKATRLTYLAQFAEDPFEVAKSQYSQVVKAVFQLWRFFSHVRQGFTEEPVDHGTIGMVLTLDAFGLMNEDLKRRIIAEAAARADNDNIALEDRCHIIFCPVHELERVLSHSNEDGFLRTLEATRNKKYNGWELYSIHKNEAAEGDPMERKKFPFDLHDLLPWWERAQTLRAQSEKERLSARQRNRL